MTKRAGLALFLAMAALFLIANRASYKGYFQDDDLNSVSWAPQLSLVDFAKGLLTPRFIPGNFRPVGHFYYYLMGSWFHLDFPKYLAVLHALHFLNVWLVWKLARKLGVGIFAASAGTLFFAFHMTVFDAYWKPMYVFDVLCATFCLTSVLLYAHKRVVLSFVAFWLAYKSKELAVMLPAVLVCYEFWFGERRWKPLVPFFVVSASFGIQGLLPRPAESSDYTFQFTPGAIWKTLSFYSSKILLIPYAGLAVLGLPLIVRDRRVWFGVAFLCLFFVPLLFLPGRLFGAYCYLPLAGAAIALAGISINQAALVTALFLIWIPWNIVHLRRNRREALQIADDNRSYVASLRQLARSSPETRFFIFDGAPFSFHSWGVEGALNYFYGRTDLRLHYIGDPDTGKLLQSDSVAVLTWDPVNRRFWSVSHGPDTPDAAYILMDSQTPLWQLHEGWYPLEDRFRWTSPKATARLRRPPHATQFELVVNISPDQIKDLGRTKVEVMINGDLLGTHEFTRSGWQTVHWDLPPSAAEHADVEFRIQPEYHPSNGDPRSLGIATVSFGFLPRERP